MLPPVVWRSPCVKNNNMANWMGTNKTLVHFSTWSQPGCIHVKSQTSCTSPDTFWNKSPLLPSLVPYWKKLVKAKLTLVYSFKEWPTQTQYLYNLLFPFSHVHLGMLHSRHPVKQAATEWWLETTQLGIRTEGRNSVLDSNHHHCH